MNLQDLVEQIELLKKNISTELNFNTLFSISKILNTQFLAPRVKVLFKDYILGDDNFIFSSSEDPNLCQFSLHKDWNNILFAWVRQDGVYLFRFPKEYIVQQNLHINHADKDMQVSNSLFKKSWRLTNNDMQELVEFLVEIL